MGKSELNLESVKIPKHSRIPLHFNDYFNLHVKLEDETLQPIGISVRHKK